MGVANSEVLRVAQRVSTAIRSIKMATFGVGGADGRWQMADGATQSEVSPGAHRGCESLGSAKGFEV